MSNKTVRFVTATCACGATFQREVKRGRPQKWCPDCVAVPFYERTQAPAVEAVEGEAQEAPKGSEHDDNAEVRSQIEQDMSIVNADHKARFASLVALGVDPLVASEQIEGQLREETLAVYAKWVPSKYAA